MTNAEKKIYLSQYYKHTLRIRRLEEQIEERETAAAGGAINISDMPKGKNHNYDPVKENAVKVGDIQTELEGLIAQSQEICDRVIRAVNTVEDPDEHAVLSLRYVRCMKWREIGEELNFSEQRLYEIHNKALKNIKVQSESEYGSVL